MPFDTRVHAFVISLPSEVVKLDSLVPSFVVSFVDDACCHWGVEFSEALEEGDGYGAIGVAIISSWLAWFLMNADENVDARKFPRIYNMQFAIFKQEGNNVVTECEWNIDQK